MSQTTDSEWDNATAVAAAEIRQAEERIARLKAAIRVFRENKVRGVAWPRGINGQDAD